MTVFSFYGRTSSSTASQICYYRTLLILFSCAVSYIFLLLLFKMFFFLPLFMLLSVRASNVHIELFSECLFLCVPRVADKTTRLDSAAPGGDQTQDLSQEPLVFLGLPHLRNPPSLNGELVILLCVITCLYFCSILMGMLKFPFIAFF